VSSGVIDSSEALSRDLAVVVRGAGVDSA
jgi:hypothetical protein